MIEPGKVVICGVGLIGGSFAMALKQARAVAEVVGVGRSQSTLEEAQRLGVIDRSTSDWRDALAGAQLVLLAIPVGQMEAVLCQLAPHLGPQTLLTDGGSTKQDVIAAARKALGKRISQFVPGHPIAGAERSGVAAAQADLYRNKRVILTPLAENDRRSIDSVRQAWTCCGAQVSELAPDEHDKTFAAVSHLPHLLAYALVHQFAGRGNSEQLFSFAAGGFRDFTR
ncbi:MAG: prephenate dehydrogenase/arogenate dehydrogenase family protein, partial [Proteobacteria bacterium]|nr:prephenate dehydrogenase/arogenate dehydrogenase family protein [Pseudomonadota bacterium]